MAIGFADYIVNGSVFKKIAVAIRTKTGKTDAMTVDQMVEAIDAIETGGSDPENPWVECIELFTNGLKQQFLKKSRTT